MLSESESAWGKVHFLSPLERYLTVKWLQGWCDEAPYLGFRASKRKAQSLQDH